jgi:hypothetical protein
LKEELVAPCGINCALCVNYLANKYDINKKGFHKTYCPGCLPRGENCTYMKNNCSLLSKGLARFCYDCKDYPCDKLKRLDKRYRTKYHQSNIENLEAIKNNGIEQFLAKQADEWRCKECGGMICCHNGLCLNCELDVLIN